MPLRSFLFLAFALSVFVSCYDKTLEGPEPVSVFSITTSVPTLNLRQDDTTSFTVTVRNETRAQAVSAIGAFAESDAPGVATVATTTSPDRFRVTAVAGGTARIIVAFGGLNPTAKDTVVVNVTPRPVATLNLTPDSTSAFVGVATTFRAALLDAAGDTIKARTATFSIPVADTAIASVTTAGVATGKTVGTARIVATSEGKADTSKFVVTLRPVNTVTVAPADTTVRVGNTVQLTATLRAANNAVVTGRPIAWTSSDPLIASVNDSGLVTGVAASNQFVTITATSEGRSGMARVIVVP
jgi:hypothetical protein